jgi:ribosomal-protein-alanine N-acetyltransferase
VTLRPASPADLDDLARLHATSFEQPWSAAEIGVLLTGPGGFGVLVEGAGFLLARSVLDEAEILTLAVDPARRREGLGSALVEAAAGLARQAGAEALFLEVAIDNTAAVALYESAGFSRAGFRPGYYRREGAGSVDALVLKRDLTG